MNRKKIIVLLALFIVPLLFYIFLSKGIYHYSNLPILTDKVEDVKGEVSLKDHFSIVCFLGEDVSNTKGQLFNLNETIYKRFHNSLYFQCVIITPNSQEQEISEIKRRLGMYTDASRWKFVQMSKEEIVSLFNSFETPYLINDDYSSDYAFIIDRELRLRGRKDDEDTVDGKLYGYDMNSVHVLKNKMRDDIGIIYYQLGQSIKKQQRREENQKFK